MNYELFSQAHGFLKREIHFLSWLTYQEASKPPLLFYGAEGFDSDGPAEFCWQSQHRHKPHLFATECLTHLTTKRKLKECMRQAPYLVLHLKNFHAVTDETLACLMEILPSFTCLKLIASGHFEARNLKFLKPLFAERMVYVPPLSSRLDDMGGMVKFYSRKNFSLSKEAEAMLKTLRWPGDAKDLREFVSEIDRYLSTSPQNGYLDCATLKTLYEQFKPCDRWSIEQGFKVEKIYEVSKEIGYHNTARLMEALLIERALHLNGGRRNLAARSMHLSPSTLSSRIQSLAEYLHIK